MNEPVLPTRLERIIRFFRQTDEPGRREQLLAYAEQSERWALHPADHVVLSDVRKDVECLDEVGVFIVRDEQGLTYRLQYGPQVQTLTRAIGTILAEGLDHAEPERVATLPPGIIQAIIGQQLVRNRSQSVYYIFNRIKEVAKRHLKDTAGQN